MPYPVGVWRCNINATLADGEIMTNTVWMRQDDVVAAPFTTQEVAERVADRWAKAISGGQGGALGISDRFASTTIWRDVAAYKVNALGKATEQAVAPLPDTTRGSSAGALPGQLALVVTLQTRRAGRSGRGRLFLGGLTSSHLANGGRMTPGSRDLILAGMRQFYIALRNDPARGDAIRPVVVSPTLGDSFKITGISIGDAYDTMRSRRNRVVEGRAAAVVDPS